MFCLQKLFRSEIKFIIFSVILITTARHVLSELYKYCNHTPAPSDTASVQLSLKYLEACNKLFENGFLSHSKIVSIQSPVLQSIQEGYSYFTSWHSNLSASGRQAFLRILLIILPSTGPLKLQDPRFLSWQSKKQHNITYTLGSSDYISVGIMVNE